MTLWIFGSSVCACYGMLYFVVCSRSFMTTMHLDAYLSAPGVLEQPVWLVCAVPCLHLAVANHNHGVVQRIITVACMGIAVMYACRETGHCNVLTFQQHFISTC